jgi:hypothetical protein
MQACKRKRKEKEKKGKRKPKELIVSHLIIYRDNVG